MKRRKHGQGGITAKGYIRHADKELAHRRVWRKHNGPVPVGYFIHHIDGDKQNNAIENLQLIDALTHKRIHSGCILIKKEWWKPCRKCGSVIKVSTGYYVRKPSGISPWCKSCCVKYATMRKRFKRNQA